MAPGADPATRVVRVPALDEEHPLDALPSWLQLGMNVQAQRIAKHLAIPKPHTLTVLLDEYPLLVDHGLALAICQRDMNGDCPNLDEFLDNWSVVQDDVPADPTRPPSPGRSP